VDVKVCPLIKHLRSHGRVPIPEFCSHCYYLGSARAAVAGMTMRLCGGDGACTHTYALANTGLPPQDMKQIKENAP
jgi:hypothetical protein